MNRISGFLKSKALGLLGHLGYQLVPVDLNPTLQDSGEGRERHLEAPTPRLTMEGALANLREVGFFPAMVVDVGAASGDFTRTCLNLFPEAGYLMFEPLQEYEPHLARLTQSHPRVKSVAAAAGSQPGSLRINVHPDLRGSSTLVKTEEQTDVTGEREVRVSTVDLEMAAWPSQGPILLKVDVQGAELMVLAGAETTLAVSDVVILEATLFNTFELGPLIHEVIAYMVDRGFCIYDLISNLYRPLDGALFEVYLIFTKQNSRLRQSHAFATPEQRQAQTELMVKQARMRFLKSTVKDVLCRLGYQVVPAGPRPPMEAALANLRKAGFVPALVVDVGAAYGDFTRTCLNLFPEAGYLLFEPLREYERHLARLTRRHPRIKAVAAAAGPEPGTMRINVHSDLAGSSLLWETEEQSEVNGEPREVRVSTVDLEMAAWPSQGPILLKVDVQGAELMVLAGAETTLAASDVVILEATLFNTFAHGPLIHEVIAYMVDRGFCVYDLISDLHRPLDGALFGVDLIFARHNSKLRQSHAFAAPK